MNVAVKKLQDTIIAEERVKFLEEAAIIGQFEHSNVVQLFGVVDEGEPVRWHKQIIHPGKRKTNKTNKNLYFSR